MRPNGREREAGARARYASPGVSIFRPHLGSRAKLITGAQYVLQASPPFMKALAWGIISISIGDESSKGCGLDADLLPCSGPERSIERHGRRDWESEIGLVSCAIFLDVPHMADPMGRLFVKL